MNALNYDQIFPYLKFLINDTTHFSSLNLWKKKGTVSQNVNENWLPMNFWVFVFVKLNPSLVTLNYEYLKTGHHSE